MRHYLIFSSSAHFALLAALIFFTRNSFSLKKPNAYYIDFIGPSRIVTMDKIAEADTAKDRKSDQIKRPAKDIEDNDSFTSRNDEPLPKPSVLAGSDKLNKPAAQAKSDEASGEPVVADFSNFPYPWYIAQVRESLWTAWTSKMPSSGSLKCTVRFDILRNGSAKGIRAERSSGNRLFDYAAETAVESAVPFPPLPDDFYEDQLTVHVEFKTTE